MYSKYDKIRNFSLQHRIYVVAFLCTFILSTFTLLFGISFSRVVQEDGFDEIQDYLYEIEKTDKEIYNNLIVEEIEKYVKGIDVSSWQGDINWSKVKDSGIDFAMIRCGYRALNSPEVKEDNTFRYNIAQANYYNIPVGIYFYSTAKNEKEVLEEATFVLNLIKDYKVTYPVVYDFETFNSNRNVGINNSKINYNATIFLNYFYAHGYNGMLYSNYNTLVNNWDATQFEGYKLWFAYYNSEPTSLVKYDMWQYTDKGRIDGITGYVDLNEAYFAYEEKIN